MNRTKRLAAFLIAVVLLFVVVVSSFYLAAEADHDCLGENCKICVQIRAFQDFLKSFPPAACAMVVAASFLSVRCENIAFGGSYLSNETLVSLKVKLSN